MNRRGWWQGDFGKPKNLTRSGELLDALKNSIFEYRNKNVHPIS